MFCSYDINKFSGLDYNKLVKDIKKNEDLSTKFSQLDIEDYNMYIYFKSTVTDSEKQILNKIITEHKPDILYKSMISPTIFSSVTSGKYYKVIGIFLYDPIIHGKKIICFRFSSLIQNGTTYSLRLFDFNTKKIIAEQEYNNKNDQLNIIIVSDLIKTERFIEIQFRGSGEQNEKVIFNYGFFYCGD
jgi:hypothetical protein